MESKKVDSYWTRKEYSYWNGRAYAINAASVYVYKSGRKNSKCVLVSVNHLINHTEDRKVSDERILQQFVGTLESVIWHSLRYKKQMELKVFLTQGKDTSCGGIEDIHYTFQRQLFSDITDVVQFLYNIYCLIYPYNTLDYEKDVKNDSSVKYWINQYKNTEMI